MIQATLNSKNGLFTGFQVTGHAGYADHGQDIVCAAVTTACQMTANAITECAGLQATVTASQSGDLSLTLETPDNTTQLLLSSLHLQLSLLEKDYPNHIQTAIREVQ